MRLTKLLVVAAALLPRSRALADGPAHDAPVLPPPGFTQDAAPAAPVASAVHVVPRAATRIPAFVRTFPDKPSSGSTNDAPVLPPPSFVSPIAAPTAAFAVVELVPPRVTSIPALVDARPVDPINNFATEPHTPSPVVLPALSPEVIATEAPCLTAACAPCQGYPSCGDHASCPGYWFAAAEATFLGIDADSGGRAELEFDDANFAGTELTLVGGEGHNDVGVAPRIVLGRQCNGCWGVVGRFWTLDDSDNIAPVTPPEAANLDGFAASESTHIRLYTADLEAVHSFAPGQWKLDAGGGIRHASLGIATNLVAAADFAGNNLASSELRNETSFDGTGLTAALAAGRRIGGSSAHLFLSGRSSMLWGSAASLSRVASSVNATSVVPEVTIENPQRDEPFAWIGEAQLGVHWEFSRPRYPLNAFFRVAAEYQRWAIDADLNGSVTFDPPNNPPIDSIAVSRAGKGRVDLYGLALAAGFLW